MHVLLAVKQQNLDVLETKFWHVSDPKSWEWQEFMTKEQIGALVQSKAADMAAVKSWLHSSLSADAQLKSSYDSIDIRLSVGEVESLFQTEIFSFVHENGHTILRSMGEHSIPSHLAGIIEFVEGIADFPMHRPSVRKVPHEKNAGSNIPLVIPQTLKTMYNVPNISRQSVVSQGPAEFQADTSFNQQDLQSFFSQTDLPLQKVSDIVGPYDGSSPDTEATLDVQYILGVGLDQADWYWTSDNWMFMWSNNFFNTDKVPDAVSISWGWAEDQQCSSEIAQSVCQTIGANAQTYVARVNTEFQKIGLRGVSLFVASGDSGANGRSDPFCTDTVLHASFPGSSPYVTTVGATMLENPKFDLPISPPACTSMGQGYACASGGTEVAVSYNGAGFTSGGGFSTYSAMPAYQEGAVAEYLKSMASELPPASYFNRTHRAFPDVSAMGNNFMIYMSGWSPVGGTSAATPTFAGVAAYLNDLSYQKKGRPLGFLNPLLYQMAAEAPEAFTDVTVGSNECTENGCSTGCQGYKAAKGWDPVTGLGTPVAGKMLSYVEKLLSGQSESSLVV